MSTVDSPGVDGSVYLLGGRHRGDDLFPSAYLRRQRHEPALVDADRLRRELEAETERILRIAASADARPSVDDAFVWSARHRDCVPLPPGITIGLTPNGIQSDRDLELIDPEGIDPAWTDTHACTFTL
jgi:hypothetical protein